MCCCFFLSSFYSRLSSSAVHACPVVRTERERERLQLQYHYMIFVFYISLLAGAVAEHQNVEKKIRTPSQCGRCAKQERELKKIPIDSCYD